MIYPRLRECPEIPEGKEIMEYTGITETEYVHREMGFRPRLVEMEQGKPEKVFFSFFPYSSNKKKTWK